MGTFNIRDYQSGDFSMLYGLWEISGINYPGRNDTPTSIAATLKHGGRLLLGVTDTPDEVIASLWISFDGRRMHLHHLCVDPRFRLQGIATALVREGIAFARQTGTQLRLDIRKDNAIPRHIFEKLGFFAYTDYDIFVLRHITS